MDHRHELLRRAVHCVHRADRPDGGLDPVEIENGVGNRLLGGKHPNDVAQSFENLRFMSLLARLRCIYQIQPSAMGSFDTTEAAALSINPLLQFDL